MPRRGTLLTALLAAAALAGVAAPAYAYATLQECADQAVDHGGRPPDCTEVNGVWYASWSDGPTTGGGGSGGFAVLFVLVVAAGIAITVWKVSTARSLARRSGMDPDVATGMTLLTDDGFEATYLAANLRQPPPAPAAPPTQPTSTRTTAERLAELAQLREQGLVTQAEHDARRQAIIDEV
jgi:hypothetical protein